MEEKTCTGCRESKPLTEFYPQKAGKMGVTARCKRCQSEQEKARRAAESPEKREARNARARKWSKDHAEQAAANKAAWYQANKARHARLVRNRRLLTSYGITIEDYERMFEDQEGRCAACGSEDTGTSYAVFHVDHDHRTGRVRALLCNGCNVALGAVNDSIPRMLSLVDYLRAQQEGQ